MPILESFQALAKDGTSHQFDVLSAEAIGDAVIISGTVDGTAVTVQTWQSALNGLSLLSQQALIGQLMLNALPPVPTMLTNLLGQFSQ